MEDRVEVPTGERSALQQTARETGERMGRQDATIDEHTRHFTRINGSIEKLASEVSRNAAATETVLSVVSSANESAQRRKQLSNQWLLALFATGTALFVATMGAAVTIIVTIVVLIANGVIF